MKTKATFTVINLVIPDDLKGYIAYSYDTVRYGVVKKLELPRPATMADGDDVYKIEIGENTYCFAGGTDGAFRLFKTSRAGE